MTILTLFNVLRLSRALSFFGYLNNGLLLRNLGINLSIDYHETFNKCHKYEKHISFISEISIKL